MKNFLKKVSARKRFVILGPHITMTRIVDTRDFETQQSQYFVSLSQGRFLSVVHRHLRRSGHEVEG